MRGELKHSMMPVAPVAMLPRQRTATDTPPMATKPKLGFSIESIVGLDTTKPDRGSPPISPPPAHQKAHSPQYYTPEEVYSTGYGRLAPRAADYGDMMSHAQYPPMMSQYPPMSMGHCQGQYPLASYLVRDYGAYPWYVARQPRILPYRPQGPQSASFILHQFRKPKRIRTAFSPSQLLTLEHAFEKNHYVVGAERKQLAQGLSLSETQVKVWFQNRRTKHKRQKQEEEQQSQSSDVQSSGNPSTKVDCSSPTMEDTDESNCEEEDEDCDSRDSASDCMRGTPT